MNGHMPFSTRRTEAGLTPEDVSTEFGVSAAAVQDWEEGKVRPPHVIRSLDLIRSFAANTDSEAKGVNSTNQGEPVSSQPTQGAVQPLNRRPATSKTVNMSATGLIKSKQPTTLSKSLKNNRKVCNMARYAPYWATEDG